MGHRAVADASNAAVGKTDLQIRGHDGHDQRLIHGRSRRDSERGDGPTAQDAVRGGPGVREDDRDLGQELCDHQVAHALPSLQPAADDDPQAEQGGQGQGCVEEGRRVPHSAAGRRPHADARGYGCSHQARRAVPAPQRGCRGRQQGQEGRVQGGRRRRGEHAVKGVRRPQGPSPSTPSAAARRHTWSETRAQRRACQEGDSSVRQLQEARAQGGGLLGRPRRRQGQA